MKICSWLFLWLTLLLGGCAPGHYESKPAYREEPSQEKFYRNPETPEEQTYRIWRENIGR